MTVVPIDQEKRLIRVRNYIARMPSLSTTATKVLEVCNRPATSPNDINKVISLDPVLTGQLLRLINSAYYSLNSHVTSLTRAIILLGINTVKNHVLSTAILKGIGGRQSTSDEFWTHSLLVGVTAKAIATIKGVPLMDREEYFVVGFLHDLGKIPFYNRFTEEYLHIINYVKSSTDDLPKYEKKIFGFDHCQVGKMIAEKWRLGGAVYDSLCYHHTPYEVEAENRPFVEIVALADMFAKNISAEDEADYLPDIPKVNDLFKHVGMEKKTLLGLRESALAEVEKARIFLTIT
ncbi:MAG: HDOD domain-containing protein [Desulfobacterales bacterium]|nr:HDOD domain-containing protein [Desulfobacterales bacterium]